MKIGDTVTIKGLGLILVGERFVSMNGTLKAIIKDIDEETGIISFMYNGQEYWPATEEDIVKED